LSFLYKNYFIVIVLISLIFSFFAIKQESQFFNWVKDHWFFRRNFKSKVASICILLGMTLLAFSLLDLRGQESSREDKVSEQKTILLIDNSLSMQAEDVRPSRIGKAVFLARHFVKNAVGHRISVILFSDNTKRIVPFTADQDLLDARISGVLERKAIGGGSSIMKALEEAIQYLKVNGNGSGNIVLYTDVEDSDDFLEEVSSDINLAIVGIGTMKGAKIPLKNKLGRGSGYKKHDGKDVISKLDKKNLEEIEKLAKYSKSWLATSYSLPTQEILNFFNNSDKSKSISDNVSTRPVLSQYLMIPGILFLIIGYLLSITNPYLAVSMLCFLSFSLRAQDPFAGSKNLIDEKKQKEQKELERKQDKYLNKWKDKGLSTDEKLDLAQLYLRSEKTEKARSLYKENLKGINEKNKEDYFNWATADLKDKKFRNALDKLDTMNNFLKNKSGEKYKGLKEKVRENTLLALKQAKEQQKKDKKKGKGKEQEQDSEGQGDESKKENEGAEPKQQENKKAKNKDKMKDLPTVLKQLVDEDNNMQKKYMDTKTGERKSSSRRDW